MARIKYYYDTESCSFEKARLDSKTVIRKGLSYLTFGGVIATLMFVYMYLYFDDEVTRDLRSKNELLAAQISEFDNEIQHLEGELQSLHQQDEEVYRTILKADPLDKQWTEGGIGGSVKHEDLGSEALDKTRERLERIQTRVKIQQASYQALLAKMKGKEDELMHMPSIRPINTDLISGFGYRFHPILHVNKLHTGLDFRAPSGTPVYATADGTVEHAGRRGNGYGIFIDLDHGYGYASKYAHLSKLLVKEGQKVRRGDVIGLSGNTGLSKGPHLHYEITKEGKKIDPVDFFYSDLAPEKFVEFKKQAQQYNESMD